MHIKHTTLGLREKEGGFSRVRRHRRGVKDALYQHFCILTGNPNVPYHNLDAGLAVQQYQHLIVPFELFLFTVVLE